MGISATEAGFRGPQVCKIVGISYRQLDYWARTDLLSPSLQPAHGSGSQRLYSFEDLVHLKVIKNLLDAGISLQRVRDAMEYLDDLGHDISDVMLASDGTSIYAYRSPDEFVDLVRRGQAVFGIAIRPVMDEVEATVSELKPKTELARGASSEAAGSSSGIESATRRAQGED